jgi:uncharacterized membrane protein YedE/YeeE
VEPALPRLRGHMSFFPYSIIVVVVSLFVAALLGFAAHRASFCSVKAVAEVLSTRRAHMLTSFVKIVLWVFAIALPLSWLAPPIVAIGGTWAFGMPALVGGALFGIGAAMNGGCEFLYAHSSHQRKRRTVVHTGGIRYRLLSSIELYGRFYEPRGRPDSDAI